MRVVSTWSREGSDDVAGAPSGAPSTPRAPRQWTLLESPPRPQLGAARGLEPWPLSRGRDHAAATLTAAAHTGTGVRVGESHSSPHRVDGRSERVEQEGLSVARDAPEGLLPSSAAFGR